MIPTLLKPSIYSIKNELIREYNQRFWNRTTFAGLFILFILYGMYSVSLSFFIKLKTHEVFTPALLHNFLSVSLLALLSVTCFSAIISALGTLFSSKELHTLLLAPIPMSKIFWSKFIHIYLLSTWMFLLVAFSFGLGLKQAFGIPWGMASFWFLNFICCSTIPTAFGIICVIIFANIVPAERLREVIVLTVLIGLFFILSADRHPQLNPEIPESFAKAIEISEKFPISKVNWLPNGYLATIIASGLDKGIFDNQTSAKLLGSSFIIILSSLVFFNLLFLRGWAKSTNTNVQRISYKSDLLAKIGDNVFQEPNCFRAFAGKECRSFLRDTTQSVQLLLLLTLTFIYLYNFRVMHSSTIVNDSFRNIWNIVLSCANILFGGCVIAAICTRFVYPSISLEGPAFQIIRSTPISLKDFIRAKFLTWYLPVCMISLILFVSGAWAISSDFDIVLSFAFIAIVSSASTVALAIGCGALYARFDWDNPIQVISGFGSLAYMFTAMIAIGVNLLPSALLFCICYSDFIQRNWLIVDRTFAIIGTLFVILLINAAIIMRSLIAAESYLASNEKIS